MRTICSSYQRVNSVIFKYFLISVESCTGNKSLFLYLFCSFFLNVHSVINHKSYFKVLKTCTHNVSGNFTFSYNEDRFPCVLVLK